MFTRPIFDSNENKSKLNWSIVSKTSFFFYIITAIVSYVCSFFEEDGLKTENAFDAVSAAFDLWVMMILFWSADMLNCEYSYSQLVPTCRLCLLLKDAGFLVLIFLP